MRPDRYRRTRPIERIGVAVLNCAIEHVDQPGHGVRRLRLPGHNVHHPLQAGGIRAHVRRSDDVLVARDAHPTVCTGAQYRQLSLTIYVRDGRVLRYAVGTRVEHAGSSLVSPCCFRPQSYPP